MKDIVLLLRSLVSESNFEYLCIWGAENPLLYVLFTMQKVFKPGQGWFETAENL